MSLLPGFTPHALFFVVAAALKQAAFPIGGEGEIRTHEPREGLPVFKTGAFNRSATSPGPARARDCGLRPVPGANRRPSHTADG